MKITLDIPAVKPFDDPETAAQELRLAAALFLFEHGEISGGTAAKVAGISRREFIDACGSRGIATANYSPEDMDREFRLLGLASKEPAGAERD